MVGMWKYVFSHYLITKLTYWSDFYGNVTKNMNFTEFVQKISEPTVANYQR